MKNHQFSGNFLVIPLYSLLLTLLVGFIIYARQNINYFQYNLKHKFEIVVFLRHDVTAPEVVGEKIRALDNVREVIFISKEEVKNKLTDLKEEIITSGDNPFPDTFSVLLTFNKIIKENADKIVSELSSINGIEELRYDSNLLGLIQNLHLLVLFTGWFLRVSVGLLILIFIIKVIFAVQARELKQLASMKENYILLVSGVLAVILAVVAIESLMRIIGLADGFVTVTLKWRVVLLSIGVLVTVTNIIGALNGKNK